MRTFLFESLPPRIGTLLLVCAVAGCGESGVDATAAAQIDTTETGRVVVTNRAGGGWDAERAWRLEEQLRIGSVMGSEERPDEFGAIASVAMDSEGRIYVLDSQAQEVRVFDPSGTFSHRIGRRGAGPGEFEFARSMVITPGDSLVIRDDGTMRYSVFGPDGEFLASVPRAIRGTNGGAAPAWVRGAYLDWAPHFPDGRFGPQFHLLPLHYTPDFASADSLPPIEHVWEILPSGIHMTYHTGVPLGAVDPSGTLWVAESSVYAIHRRTLTGDTTLSMTMEGNAVPVGELEREALRNDLGNNLGRLNEILDALPSTLPILPVLFTDDAGHLFALPHTVERPFGTAMDVFGRDGVFLGRVDVPSDDTVAATRAELIRAYDDHVIMVRTDPFDVPYVVVYRLVKPE